MKLQFCLTFWRTFAALALFLLTAPGQADDLPDCCRGKVWKLVKKEKTVTVTCYGCKCKEIRLPGQSCEGELITEKVVCGADSCSVSPGIAKVTYSTDVPGGGRTRTVKQLVKYEVTKKVPSYVWELVDACGDAAPVEQGKSASPLLP